MKRTPLRRRSPLRSRTPTSSRSRIKPRRTPRRVPEGYRDPEYLAWLRTQACRVGGVCFGAVEAHHLRHDEHGNTLGARLKDDRRAISLCSSDHRCLHALTGPFGIWNRETLRAWQDQELAHQRAEYLAQKRS